MIVLIDYVAQFLFMAIFARVILSWFPQIRPNNPLVRITWAVTEPILAPIRRIVPTFGMFDFTPLIALTIIYVVQQILLATFR